MGNTNSTPTKDAEGDADLHRSWSPSVRRYHSISHATTPTGTVRPSKLVHDSSAFGRISSLDESSSPTRSRSRSGSLTGFWTQRRGSTLNEDEVRESSPLGKHVIKTDGEEQATTPTPGSEIDSTESGVKKTADLPSTAQTFNPRNFVSPHPSPSVATHAHYASGLSSHHSGAGPSHSLHASVVAPNDRSLYTTGGTEPQQVPSGTPHAAHHRHPLFGIAGGNMFQGTSVSTAAASPPIGASPAVSSVPVNQQDAAAPTDDSRPTKPPAALPSYLKIPTTIPSTYASASSPPGSTYSMDREERPPSPSLFGDDNKHMQVVGGGGAAAAVLNPVDIVLKPGSASRVSSPIDDKNLELGSEFEQKDATPSQEQEVDQDRLSRSLERTSMGEGGARGTSRTPTPTPGSYGTRTMPPTSEKRPTAIAMPSTSPATVVAAELQRRRSVVDGGPGYESGASTPALPLGLTSAPPSAGIPALARTESGSTATSSIAPLTPKPVTTSIHPADREASSTSSQPQTPARSAGGSSTTTPSQVAHPNLMPIVLTWTAGGREVFVTGTFANEWRSKILLHRSKRDHSCVLHLPPGTHRLKFIVDDRWRVSRDLPTATDGDGNLVNYVEIPNVGPAHPGPLSAPGEDLPDERKEHSRERSSKLDSKRTTMDLVEEARKAAAKRRGDLDDFFGLEDDGNSEETWTSEIPAALLAAQEAEEAYGEEGPAQHDRDDSSSSLPAPPALPRQLEKVILNSSPANPSGGAGGGTVDDNSILPAPNHVVLNHLTASSIKGGVLAVGTTTRYKRKYVTTVYYRPVQV